MVGYFDASFFVSFVCLFLFDSRAWSTKHIFWGTKIQRKLLFLAALFPFMTKSIYMSGNYSFYTKWKYQCRNIKELSLRQWGKHIPVPLSSLGDLISLRNTRASSMSALALKSPCFPMKLLVGLGLSKQSQRDSFCVMHEIQVMRSIILCITNSHCINLSFTFFLLLLAGYHIL